eukprot:1798792-Lingulodinium_polyedra.AAC.1
MREHSAAVQAAKVKALLAWQHYQCFSRKPRKEARNIIDARWVIKWKWVEDVGKKERVVRARLTVRGSKDLVKDKLATYVGTASFLGPETRCGHRCSSAVAPSNRGY